MGFGELTTTKKLLWITSFALLVLVVVEFITIYFLDYPQGMESINTTIAAEVLVILGYFLKSGVENSKVGINGINAMSDILFSESDDSDVEEVFEEVETTDYADYYDEDKMEV